MNYFQRLDEIFLIEGQLKTISQQEAIDRKFFGPVYHGTTSDRMEKIQDQGFKVFTGDSRSGDIRHGYEDGNRSGYNGQLPIHHLGFGIYFTTVRNIVKNYAEKGTKNIMYYLDVPRLETINFGSPVKMMKWWVSNGYDPNNPDRVDATKKLTDTLQSKYDAVWFKGKEGFRRALDGDQIVVFDPERIYMVDNKLSNPETFDIGSKVKRKSDGMIGVVLRKEDVEHIRKNFPGAVSTWLTPDIKYRLSVKWNKGGTDLNVLDTQVDPVIRKT